jgi:hypothetical protein
MLFAMVLVSFRQTHSGGNMATRAVKKSGKKTSLREVGARKPAKRPIGRNTRATKGSNLKTGETPTDRDPQGTRHGKKAPRRDIG